MQQYDLFLQHSEPQRKNKLMQPADAPKPTASVKISIDIGWHWFSNYSFFKTWHAMFRLILKWTKMFCRTQIKSCLLQFGVHSNTHATHSYMQHTWDWIVTRHLISSYWYVKVSVIEGIQLNLSCIWSVQVCLLSLWRGYSFLCT